MSKLSEGMAAADRRKRAAIGDDANGMVMSPDAFADRAIFSGFDISHDELEATAHEVGNYFANMAFVVGLHHLFVACWVDGLLTGLMTSALPPQETGSEGTDASGPDNPDG